MFEVSNHIALFGFLAENTNKVTNIAQEKTGVIPSLVDRLGADSILTYILLSIVAVVLLVLIRLLVLKIVWKNTEKAEIRYKWRKFSGYTVLILGIFIVSQIWVKEFKSILTFLGLVSAGIAIALKDFVVNFLGWIFIISSKPFQVGDRIQMKDFAGDVIDIKSFNFTIMEIGNWVKADQSTGRILHIPNGKIFTETVANYGKAFRFIWHEIPVNITFASNWQKAKKILQSIADKHCENILKVAERYIKESSKIFMIYYTTFTPIVYTSVKDNGILLTVRYLCDPKSRRGSENFMWEQILSEFSKHKDIKFAPIYFINKPQSPFTEP